MNRTRIFLAIAAAGTAALAGCAALLSAEQLDQQFLALMKGSFRNEGIATTDRLDQ